MIYKSFYVIPVNIPLIYYVKEKNLLVRSYVFTTSSVVLHKLRSKPT